MEINLHGKLNVKALFPLKLSFCLASVFIIKAR